MSEAKAFWLDQPVFVTGATGMLGGWLVRRLLEHGAQVTCLVRDHVPRSMLLGEELINKVNVVYGDINDQLLLERAFGEYEIQTVLHLAAQTIVGVANRNPVSTFESNIIGTWTVLEAVRRSPKIKAVVLASSDKAYGEQPQLPYSEAMPLQGKHPYDVSKSCSDLIGQAYATTYDIPVAITRCGNFYGGGDLNFNRVIPGTIRSIIRGIRPEIRSDGSPIRDYLYVEDGAAAYMDLAMQLTQRKALRGKAYNFSTEHPMSVTQIVQQVLKVMNSDLEPVIMNQAHHEIQAQYLDATLAKAELDWEPRFSLDQGLSETVRWYQQFFESQI
ncbi:MAG: GDP-mannose 4,6-dehydratase [Phycisphaeraceae bacterium JB051]